GRHNGAGAQDGGNARRCDIFSETCHEALLSSSDREVHMKKAKGRSRVPCKRQETPIQASLRLQYARPIRISSTPAACVKMQRPNESGWFCGALRMVSLSAFNFCSTASSAVPVGFDHATRTQPLKLSSSSPK